MICWVFAHAVCWKWSEERVRLRVHTLMGTSNVFRSFRFCFRRTPRPSVERISRNALLPFKQQSDRTLQQTSHRSEVSQSLLAAHQDQN